MYNVYCRLVSRLSDIAEPLNQLLIKVMRAQFSPLTKEMQNSYELLKAALTDPPVLELQDDGWRLSI